MLAGKKTTTMAIPNSDADANQPLDGSVKKIGAAGAAWGHIIALHCALLERPRAKNIPELTGYGAAELYED